MSRLASRRVVAGVLLTVLLVPPGVVIGIALLPPAWMGRLLAGVAERFVDADVTIGRARVLLWSGIELESVVVGPPPGFDDDPLAVERLDVRLAPAALLWRRVEVEELTVVGPVVVIDQRTPGLNWARLFPSNGDPPATSGDADSATSGDSGWSASWQGVSVRDLTLRIRAEGTAVEVSPLHLEADGRMVDPELQTVARIELGDERPGGVDFQRAELDLQSDLRMTTTATASVDFEAADLLESLALRWRHHGTVRGLRAAGLSTSADLEIDLDASADRGAVELRRFEIGKETRLRARASTRDLGAWSARTATTGAARLQADGSISADEWSAVLFGPEPSVAGRAAIDGVDVRIERRGEDLELVQAEGRVRVTGFRLTSGEVAARAERAQLEVARGPTPDVFADLELEAVDASFEGLRLASLSGTGRLALAPPYDRPSPRLTAALEVGAVDFGSGAARSVQLRLDATGQTVGLDGSHRRIEANAVVAADGVIIEGGPEVRAPRVELQVTSVPGDGRSSRMTLAAVSDVSRLELAGISARRVRLESQADVSEGQLRSITSQGRIPELRGPDFHVLGARFQASVEGQAFTDASVIQVPRRATVSVASDWSSATFSDLSVPGSMAIDADVAWEPELVLYASRTELRAAEALAATVELAGESEGSLRVEAKVEVPAVERLAAALPAAYTADLVPPLRGRVSLGVDAEVPGGLLAPRPLDADGRFVVRLQGVDVAMKDVIVVRGANGQGEVEHRASRLQGSFHLDAETADAVETGVHVEQLDLEGELASSAAGERLSIRGRTERVGVASVTGNLGAGRLRITATHPRGGGVHLDELEVSSPALGVEVRGRGRFQAGRYGVWQPSLALTATASLARLLPLVPQLSTATGTAAVAIDVRSPSPSRWTVRGSVSARGLGAASSALEVAALTGTIPVRQELRVAPPSYRPEVAGARGMVGDDIEARLEELFDRARAAKLIISPRDILIDAPTTADYQALRPYGRPPGPDVVADRVRIDDVVAEDVIFEPRYEAGLLQVRRLAFGIWEGDVLLESALQLTPGGDLRLRVRGTATKVNLDHPYAIVQGREPKRDPKGTGPLTTSAILDLSYGLLERQLNGSVDLLRVTRSLLELGFGCDRGDRSAACRSLATSERFGVRPTKGRIWIANNLLSATFDWQRLWLHVHYESGRPLDLLVDTIQIFGRLITVPTAGASIINVVNSAFRRTSVGSVVDRYVEQLGLPQLIEAADPYLTTGDGVEAGGAVGSAVP